MKLTEGDRNPMIEEKDCPHCNGTGKIKVCTICEGKGVVMIKDDRETSTVTFCTRPCPKGCPKPKMTFVSSDDGLFKDR